jgi:5-bromo-4-chloroindolyl phosphate hydrolysis protein
MPEKNAKALKWVKTGLIVYFLIVIKFVLIVSIILAVDLARAGSALDQNLSTILVIRLARLGSDQNLSPQQK